MDRLKKGKRIAYIVFGAQDSTVGPVSHHRMLEASLAPRRGNLTASTCGSAVLLYCHRL
jgi:hypothetical protein